MFARLASVFVALLAMTSVVSATCKDVCCDKVGLAPTGYQGTGCKLAAHHHGKCHYKFCCLIYDGDHGVAAKCTEPTPKPPTST